MPTTIGFREGLEAITKLALELADQTPTPIILIDGRAGSGKSTFATQLRDNLFKAGDSIPVLIAMDDLYPGWDGLRAGSAYLDGQILQPIAAGRGANWQVWDWPSGVRGAPEEPGNGWREFVGGNTLLVEGCGSISIASAEKAQLKIWVEAGLEDRRERFHSRDNGAFDEYWSVWAAQEDEFYAEHRSPSLADFVIEN